MVNIVIAAKQGGTKHVCHLLIVTDFFDLARFQKTETEDDWFLQSKLFLEYLKEID